MHNPIPAAWRWILANTPRRVIASIAVLGVVGAAVAIPLRDNKTEARLPSPPQAGPDNPCAADEIRRPPAAAASAWSRITLPAAQECYTLVPSKRDASGVAADATFVLTSNVRVGAAALEKIMSVEPSVPLRVTPIAEAAKKSTYRVEPARALSPGIVYRFRLLEAPNGRVARSWAFQTQDKLRVVQTLPADRATDVPTNVGIELTFSQDGVTGVESRLKVAPATAGRFEVHKRTVVFVPKSLKRATLYTVTLAPGTAIAGSASSRIETPFVFRFETGTTERSGGAPQPAVEFSRGAWESATREQPVLGLFSSGDGAAPKSLRVTVYRLADAQAWVSSLGRLTSVPSWARLTRSGVAPPTKGLPKIATFTASLQSVGSHSSDYFIRFPDRLASGYYLAQSTVGRDTIQTWMQVTDVATYSALSPRRTLVWANDLASKQPLAGARVAIIGGAPVGNTGRDGVIAFETPNTLLRLTPSPLGNETDSEAVGNLLVTAPDGRNAVVPLADIFSGFRDFEFREYVFPGDPSPYWRYLYSDRHLYRQQDTVHFWGLVRKREAPIAASDVVVEIVDNESNAAIARTTVKTSRTGTFLGSIEIEGATVGSYSLQARIGGQVVASTYFEVQDFIKPAYRIDVEPSPRAVFAGDRIAFDSTASFFEGTPVPAVDLRYEGDREGRVATRADGRAHVEFTASCGSSCSPFNGLSMSFFPALSEEGEISGGAYAQVFAGAVALEDINTKVAGGRALIDGTAYNVDLTRLNNGTATDYSDYRGGVVARRSVSAVVEEISYKRVEEGETYDFTAKIVRKTYRYEEVRKPVGTFNATTDGRGRFTISFNARNDRSYQAQLSVADAKGRVSDTSVYATSEAYGFSEGIFPYLSAADEGPYRLGDRVSLSMVRGPAVLPSGGTNHYLFYSARDGIRDYAVGSEPRYSFVFGGAHLPNVHVVGVRFTGTAFEEVRAPFIADFDRASRELRIAVETDRARYRPGEKAKLAVKVTDPAGKPVSDAEVLLSAVDEAIFRLEGQGFFSDLNILESLYENVHSGILRVYASHAYPLDNAGGEFGGEGGERRNFKDTGLFERVTTGKDGRTSAVFSLPDNVTSWRITAIAVTEGLFAGSATALVPVGLPMFVDVAANSSYLVGDKPKIPVRAFGDALKAGTPVTFTLSAPSLGPATTAGGKAFATTDMPLPALKEGRHEITVRAEAGGQTDAVVRVIEVVPSRLVAVTARFAEAGPGPVAVEGSKNRVTRVVLTDHNRGRYYPALEQLSWTYGDRLDQMLARNLAQELLLEHFKEAPSLPAIFHPSRYQTEKGGVAIFPFADNDLALSARVAAVAPDRFGRSALADYLREVLESPKETRERAVIALSGLAALGEPVLDDVQALAARKDLTWRERVWLAEGAVAAGDEDTATAVYRGLLEQYGEQRGDHARLKVGADADDTVEATALAADVGARLGDDRAALLFDYTVVNPGKDVLVAIDQVAYLVAALPRLPAAPVRFSYTAAGKRETVSLERGNVRALALAPKDLASLNLKVESGTLGIGSFFLAPLDPATVKPNGEVSVSRTYNASAARTITVRRGDLVRITLSFGLSAQATRECYQVSDLLPSGLVPVIRPYDRGIEDNSISYPYSIEGQRVSFCVSTGGRSPLVYYARAIGTGEFLAEPALIQSQRAPGVVELTRTTRVSIR